MFKKYLFNLITFELAAQALTIGPIADLVISNKEIAPDGFQRQSTLAGGTFPGPVIVGNKGDHFKINVKNDLTDPSMYRATTIHWHGIWQNGNNWADGGAMVSQCPIVQNSSFLYEFDVLNQAAVQYCDGLRGAFVIYDPEDPYKKLYDVDDESTIITLADWYHEVAPQRPSQPLTTLINGLGRTITGEVNDTQTELAVISVEQGVRYRFRLIGLSCEVPFNFTIDNHSMTIIEADGEYTTPLDVDSLWVYPGQRYSVVVHANQTIDNYWIRADMLSNRGPSGFDGGRNSAIFRYEGAPTAEPVTLGLSTLPLNEADLQNQQQKKPCGTPQLGGADIVVPIRQSYNANNQTFNINDVQFQSPSVPVLLQIFNGTYDIDSLMPTGSIYKLPANKSVEIQISGLSTGGPVTI
ncbi:hypothetical protein H0H93_007984 [Arthromyces matolae]|nr:hypothetical protein H0H93_007984 [Arthromyces matolae]